MVRYNLKLYLDKLLPYPESMIATQRALRVKRNINVYNNRKFYHITYLYLFDI